jgi:hypothetical protein
MSFETTHKAWHIDCRPQQTPDGRFLAHAVLTSSTGSKGVVVTITPPLDPFNEEKPAALAALQAAKDWIDSRD